MFLSIKSNAAGEVRVTRGAERRVSKVAQSAALSPLVHSSILQDGICEGYAAMKPGFGWQPDGKRFTSTAKRRIREAGAVLDEYGPGATLFLTGTLPGSTLAAVRALAAWSSWVTSRLSQWIRDNFTAPGFIMVWEYQKRGALHLHIAVALPKPDERRVLCERFKRYWVRLIDGVEKRSGARMWERSAGGTWANHRWLIRTDAQVALGNVGRYLAKYLSKGSCRRRGQIEFPPAAWWSISRNLRVICDQRRWTIRIGNLRHDQANAKFERLAAEIVGCASVAYPVSNPYDKRYSGVIAYMPASIAGIIMRLVMDIYAPDIGSGDVATVPVRCPVRHVQAILGNARFP